MNILIVAVIETAVGGGVRGRRWATTQINRAYVVLLSSQFQGFCRDLHSEAVDKLVRAVTPTILQNALRVEFASSRKLDRGNPNPGNIGSDFGRVGIAFWKEVVASDARNEIRKERIEAMSRWRNAIAHQDFPSDLAPSVLTLRVVREWRGGCKGLARSFDRVLRRYIAEVSGVDPW